MKADPGVRSRGCGSVRAVRFFVVVCALVVPSLTHADLRVWEQGRDPESGELRSPDEHRFVDLMGLAQPALALRFRDDAFGGFATTPQLRRMRLGVHAQPWWWVGMVLEIEVGFESVRLQDGYLELRPARYARLTAGRFRIGLTGPGRFHESNLAFVERPAYTEMLPIRQDGFRIHGEVGGGARSTTPTFQYALSIVAASDFLAGELEGVGLALDLRLHVLGLPDGADEENDRARNTRPRIALGGTLYSNCHGAWTRGFGADGELRAYGLYVSGGYFWYTSNAADGRFGYDECGEGFAPAERQVHSGAHVQVQYMLPEILFPVPRQALEVLARWELSDPESPYDSSRPVRGGGVDTPGYRTPGDPRGATRHGLTVGVTWWATPEGWLRVMLNYRHEFEDETILDPVSGRSFTSPQNDVLWLQIQGKL